MRKIGRREPYTVRGVGRVPCLRCGKPSRYQWQACALDRRFCAVCEDCDIDLNRMVLEFFRVDEIEERMRVYEARARS